MHSQLEPRLEPTDGQKRRLQPLSPSDFMLFQRWIHERTGIYLHPSKRGLVVWRLSRRIQELGLPTFRAYYERMCGEPAEQEQMINRICTHETSFFRESKQFEVLERRLIPEWQRAAYEGQRTRRLRIWSAACSTGEEPYSIGMSVLDGLRGLGSWDIEIAATDLSTRVLEQARAGLFSVEQAKQIPEKYLREYMLRGVGPQAGRMKVSRTLRSIVHFDQLNLQQERYPVAGPLDLILCRNVLIYFGPEAKQRVLGRLIGMLRPGGYLFLGHAETLSRMPHMVCVHPTVYRRVDDAAPRYAAR